MKAKLDGTGADNRAFQIKDLACLLAVVGLLASVQLATLANSREASMADQCRGNIRRLTQAWLMYSDDNAGQLVPNNGAISNLPFGTWVAGWLDFTPHPDNTNTDYLIGAEETGKYGLLGPYVQRDISVFRCPADSTAVQINGRWYNRVRTVSMNSWMGGNAYCGQAQYYVRNLQQSDLSTPSRRWVLIDELPGSINDSQLQVRMDSEYILDYPGSSHSGGTWLGYGDGHVDFHRWVDPRTLPSYRASESIPLNLPSPGNVDMAWLRERTTDKKPGAPL